jgi:hypothetical protein
MYIVQVTSARKNPLTGQFLDQTVPVFLTEDLVRAIAHASRIDETRFQFVGSDTQGVKVFAAATDLPDDRFRGNGLPIFSRTPLVKYPPVGAGAFLWNETWHDEGFKKLYESKRSAL